MAGEPQGLRQREGERAREPRAGKDTFLQGAAADGLAREADRLGGGTAHEIVGVGPQRVEVDERERRLQLGCGALESLVRVSIRTSKRPQHSIGPGVSEASLGVQPGAHSLEAVPVGVAGTQGRGRLEVALAPMRAPAELVHDRLDRWKYGSQAIPRYMCTATKPLSRPAAVLSSASSGATVRTSIGNGTAKPRCSIISSTRRTASGVRSRGSAYSISVKRTSRGTGEDAIGAIDARGRAREARHQPVELRDASREAPPGAADQLEGVVGEQHVVGVGARPAPRARGILRCGCSCA